MGILDRLTSAYNALVGPNINKALQPVQMDVQKSDPEREMKALLEDPLGLVQATGYKDKQFSLSYDVLRRMASRDAVISSIITTRVNQVSTFTAPARFSRTGLGYEIRLRDPDESATKEDKDNMVAIEQFLENTGYNNDNGRDDFDTFIRKITRDRLTFDQVNFEIIPDSKGRPAEFIAVDASTIRKATEQIQPEAVQSGGLKKNEEVKYVQVINGSVTAYFTAEEMSFGVANPRTDILMSGYGYSELEMIIHQVTSHLWAEEYNSRFFSQGGTTKGILNLKGNANAPIAPHQLESFKRQWLSQVSGMTGAWKTPVVSVDGLEYINVSQSNREMEFEKWMNYLINIACAVYQIDPAEINFPNRGGAGNSGGGGLGDGGIEDRLNHSRDKGLRPLLRFIESLVNKHIVSKFDQKYVFSFVGVDAKSEKESASLRKMDVETYKTVNEIRKEEGLTKIEGGDILLNPQYIQYLGQLQQQEAMKQQQEQGGSQFGGSDFSEDEQDSFAYDDDDEEQSDEQDSQEESDTEGFGKSLSTRTTRFLTIEIEDE
ncbi:Phage portal protein [compost metagenome]